LINRQKVEPSIVVITDQKRGVLMINFPNKDTL
jgi:hypothetical protein